MKQSLYKTVVPHIVKYHCSTYEERKCYETENNIVLSTIKTSISE